MRKLLLVYFLLSIFYAYTSLQAQSLGTGPSANYSSAVSASGKLYTWGENFGQLGNNSNADASTPQDISAIGALTGKTIVSVANGESHVLALASDGTVYAWGNGERGQLGNGIFYDSEDECLEEECEDGDCIWEPCQLYGSKVPLQVPGLSGIKAIAAGSYHSLALGKDGKVYTWGDGGDGQLGNGKFNLSNVPVQVKNLAGITAIASGSYHSLALGSDGHIYAWGSGYFGTLGNGKFYKTSPTGSAIPVQVHGLAGVKAIASGRSHSLALGSDNKVYAWGLGMDGELGNGKFYDDWEGSALPVQVQELTGVKSIAGGGFHSMALLSDGKVYAWGYGRSGQLGNGKFYNSAPWGSALPVQVLKLPEVKSISGGSQHSLAIGLDNQVYAWGEGRFGELGNGNFYNYDPYGSAKPVKVQDLFIDDPSLWNYRFGGSGEDRFTVVIKTSDGGYLSGGYSNSPVSGDKSQESRGGADYWIVKMDAHGTKQWDKRYGGFSHDYLNRIIPTQDGGYLLAGSSTSDKGGDKTQARRGQQDYWIVKINSNGTKEWDQTYGGSGFDDLRKVNQLYNGDYLLAGTSNSPISGDKNQGSQGGSDYWVLRVSSTGMKLWDKRYGGSANESLESFTKTQDGGFLLAGSSASGKSGNKTQVSRGGKDFWLVKIDQAGQLRWDKSYGGNQDDELYSVGITPTGEYFVAGHSSSDESGDKSQASWYGSRDYWLLKLNQRGQKLWDKRFGGSGTETLRSVIQMRDGGYVLAGTSDSGFQGDKTQENQGGTDYWIVKTDAAGNKEYDEQYGGSGNEEFRYIQRTKDGGLLIGGRSDSGVSGNKTQPNQGLTDYWLLKVAPRETGTASNAKLAVKAGLKVVTIKENVFPNPFTSEVFFRLTLTQTPRVSLDIYSVSGQLIRQIKPAELGEGNHQLSWDGKDSQGRSVPSGLYFYQLYHNHQLSSGKLLKAVNNFQ